MLFYLDNYVIKALNIIYYLLHGSHNCIVMLIDNILIKLNDLEYFHHVKGQR